MLFRVEPGFNIYLQCFGFFLLRGVAGVGGGISSRQSLSNKVGEDRVSKGLILRSGESGGLSSVLARSTPRLRESDGFGAGRKPGAGSGSKPIETDVPVRCLWPLLARWSAKPTGSKNPKFLRASKVLLDLEPNSRSIGTPACSVSRRSWNGLRISSLSFFSHRWASEFTGERKSRTTEPGLRALRASPGSKVWFP